MGAPKRMCKLLENAPFTNGKSEADTVATMYEETFSAVASSQTMLQFHGLHWGPEECPCLAEVLPLFTQVVNINMWGSSFGELGPMLLGPAFAAMPVLEELCLSWNVFGSSPKRVLESIPPTLKSLTLLSEPGCWIEDTEMRIFLEFLVNWLPGRALRKLRLSSMCSHKKLLEEMQEKLTAAWVAAGKDTDFLEFKMLY